MPKYLVVHEVTDGSKRRHGFFIRTNTPEAAQRAAQADETLPAGARFIACIENPTQEQMYTELDPE